MYWTYIFENSNVSYNQNKNKNLFCFTFLQQVVQINMQRDNTSLPAPKLQLVGFRRVFVPTSQKVTVQFTVTGQQMELWFDDISAFNVVPGKCRKSIFF